MLDFAGSEAADSGPLARLFHSNHHLKGNSEERILALMHRAGFVSCERVMQGGMLFGFFANEVLKSWFCAHLKASSQRTTLTGSVTDGSETPGGSLHRDHRTKAHFTAGDAFVGFADLVEWVGLSHHSDFARCRDL
jgi:hypothetical protein